MTAPGSWERSTCQSVLETRPCPPSQASVLILANGVCGIGVHDFVFPPLLPVCAKCGEKGSLGMSEVVYGTPGN